MVERRLAAAATEEAYDAGDDDDDVDVEAQASDDVVAEEAVEEAEVVEIADESSTHDAATPYWLPLPVAVDDVRDVVSASVVVSVVAYFADAEYAIGEVNSDVVVVVAVQMAIVVDDVVSVFGVQSTASPPLSRFYGVYSELFVVVAVAVLVVVAVDSNFVPIQSMASYFHSTLIFSYQTFISTIFNHSKF